MPELRIFFMMAETRWPQPNPVLLDAIERMRSAGAQVIIGVGRLPVPADCDLYVLKSKSQYWLAAAEALEERNSSKDLNTVGTRPGIRLLDSCASRRLCMDKGAVYARLRSAGIPVPEIFEYSTVEDLSRLLQRRALILKPRSGGCGRGIQILRDVSDIREPFVADGRTIVQEYLEHEAEDVKIYAIGDELHAVRKEFRPNSYLSAGRPWPLDRELRDIALRCGAVCGLGLYGIDIILTGRGPMVVDLNWFPSYRAVPNAGRKLAEYILSHARTEVAQS